jgi:bacterioferritin-associated ferredoxin
MELSYLMRPRKLCLCKGVSRADIAAAVRAGADTFPKLVNKTQATTGCGTCFTEVHAAFCEELEQERCRLTGQMGLKF